MGHRRNRASRRSRKGGKDVSYTLDRFTINDLRHWQSGSRAIKEYHLRVFHELEAQRQLYRGELLNALKGAKHQSVFSLQRWVRIVDYKYSNQPLSAAGSVKSIGGRFNVGEDLGGQYSPFHALYLAEDTDTAFREYYGLARNETRGRLTPLDLALTPGKSFTCVNVSGSVANLLDITEPKHLKALCEVISKFVINSKFRDLLRGTSVQPLSIVRTPKLLIKSLLYSGWRELGMQLGIPSNSQVFGRIAFEAGYDGIVYESARGDGRCLCLFLENLTNSETVLKLADPAPSEDTVIELSSATWSKLVTPFSFRKAASRLLAELH